MLRAIVLAVLSLGLPAGAMVLSRSPSIAQLSRTPLSSRSAVVADAKIPWDDDQGYGPIGSLIRQGPTPFFQRLVDPAKYEKSVKMYMIKNRCSRMEAQGNMDAYLADPNGWTLTKLNAKKGGYEPDYANINTDPKQLILTAVWASVVFAIAGRMIYVAVYLPELTEDIGKGIFK
mmetsp:Transcript_21092/g.56813  ORF Transcript_21092/g.56813 Transcript_21092/m.56813 type:complete len:175 (-) Transcript_21092:382-906(-)